MKKNILITFLIMTNLHADLSATAGQTLLSSFKCESTNGSAVQDVQNSLSTLQTTLQKIAEQQKECLSDFASVGKLPEIDAVLKQIDSYGLSEDIKKQENIISEALSDLSMLNNIPMNSPDRSLYPDEATLQMMVSQARAQLITLRGQYGIEKGRADRQKYIDGVRQLDLLATELSGALQKNSPCFQKYPTLRNQVITGLVGISGFFAKSPAGIGLTLAGKVLGNLFNLSDVQAINENQNFEASNQAQLVAGMSCTLENLATQHCRLTRQKKLLEQLESPPCVGRTCSPEIIKLQSLVKSGKTATDAVESITNWIGSKTENTSDQITAQKINTAFLTSTTNFEQQIAAAKSKYNEISNSSLKGVRGKEYLDQIKNSICRYSSSLFGESVRGRCAVDNSSKELQVLISGEKGHEKDSKYGELLFIFKDEKEIQDLVLKTKNALKASNPYFAQSAIMLNKSEDDVALETIANAVNTKNETPGLQFLSIIDEKLNSIDIFDNIKSKIASYKSLIASQTSSKSNYEQLGNFLVAF